MALQFVESECEVLPSKERCPYLVVAEMLEQPFTSNSEEIYTQGTCKSAVRAICTAAVIHTVTVAMTLPVTVTLAVTITAIVTHDCNCTCRASNRSDCRGCDQRTVPAP